jgi:catechol 2,3-dioxygenase-like lactoylglutathione lyase family enzyme
MTTPKEYVMSPVHRPALSHIALTVTDLDASIAWYERVFDIKHLMEEAHDGGVGKVLADDEMSLVIVLHHHDNNEREGFAETRTGLDHLGLNVPSRADLEAWQSHLEANGVERAAAADKPLTQSPIADRPYGSVLVFRDPDNIQLELVAPAVS